MLPGSLQALTFGYRLNQSSHGDDAVQPAVGVPCCPAAWDINLWLQDLDWSLNGVVLQSSLRSLTFGFRFYQNFRSFRRS